MTPIKRQIKHPLPHPHPDQSSKSSLMNIKLQLQQEHELEIEKLKITSHGKEEHYQLQIKTLQQQIEQYKSQIHQVTQK